MKKGIRITSAVLAMGLGLAFGHEGVAEAAVVRARGAMTIESLEALEQELKDLLSMLGTPQTD